MNSSDLYFQIETSALHTIIQRDLQQIIRIKIWSVLRIQPGQMDPDFLADGSGSEISELK